MIRKLAVTVFALSFAALGCGSDSGSSQKDTGVEAGRPDTSTNVLETQGPGIDVQPARLDGGVDGPGIDTPAVDSPAVDGPAGVDTAKIDGIAVQLEVQAPDAPGLGIDVGQVAIDAASID